MNSGRKDYILDILYDAVELLSHPIDNITRDNIKQSLKHVIEEIEDEQRPYKDATASGISAYQG